MLSRTQMFCSLLLLLSLTTCWVRGFWSLHYDVEENSDVTVEWSFSSSASVPVDSVKIHCVMAIPMQQVKVFFSLDPNVVEVQDQQFAGRVRCDTDALWTGRLRLHLSRVSSNDSGPYLCIMGTEEGRRVRDFTLNVTEAVEKPKPVTLKPAAETPKPAPGGRNRGRICLYVVLGLTAACLSAAAAKTKLKAGSASCCETPAAPCWTNTEQEENV